MVLYCIQRNMRLKYFRNLSWFPFVISLFIDLTRNFPLPPSILLCALCRGYSSIFDITLALHKHNYSPFYEGWVSWCSCWHTHTLLFNIVLKLVPYTNHPLHQHDLTVHTNLHCRSQNIGTIIFVTACTQFTVNVGGILTTIAINMILKKAQK